jgi:Zn-dependent protease with chaperone function
MKILPRDYIHPEDLGALENLKSIPLFSACLKVFMKIGIERYIEGQSMAQKIRLGPDQLADVYRFLPPACEVLGIETPEFYLEMNPQPNAYTQGDTRIFITVTSGLLELLEDDEIEAVIAHECGHIACHHVLYHTMAQMLAQFGAAIFGPLAALSMPVQLGLLYWVRRSELSADRAAAVAMKGSKSVVETMMRLAGGPRSITAKVNVERYLEQAEAFDKLQESQWDKFLQAMAVMNMDHPFLSVRAREITRWCQTDHFTKILDALEMHGGPECPACGSPVQADWKYCKTCGRMINPAKPLPSNEEIPS